MESWQWIILGVLILVLLAMIVVITGRRPRVRLPGLAGLRAVANVRAAPWMAVPAVGLLALLAFWLVMPDTFGSISWEGRRILAVCVAGIAIASMALAGWARKAVVVFFIIFAVIGLGRPVIDGWESSAQSKQQTRLATPVTSTQCPGIPATPTYSAGTVPFNENRCQFRIKITQGCVTLLDSWGRTEDLCVNHGPASVFADRIQVRSGVTAKAMLLFCPKDAPGDRLDQCSA